MVFTYRVSSRPESLKALMASRWWGKKMILFSSLWFLDSRIASTGWWPRHDSGSVVKKGRSIYLFLNMYYDLTIVNYLEKRRMSCMHDATGLHTELRNRQPLIFNAFVQKIVAVVLKRNQEGNANPQFWDDERERVYPFVLRGERKYELTFYSGKSALLHCFREDTLKLKFDGLSWMAWVNSKARGWWEQVTAGRLINNVTYRMPDGVILMVVYTWHLKEKRRKWRTKLR